MPAYSRPHSYTLNRQHPLADVAWLVVGDARQQAEIVGGELSSLGSTGSYGYGKLGKSLVSADDTNGGVSWNFPARLRDNFRDCSMAWFGELTSQASYGKLFCVPWFDNGTWNTPYVSLEFARDGALDTGRFDFANSSGVNVSVSSSSGYLDTSGALRLYGVTRSGADVTFWRDGQVYSEHAAAVGTDPVNWNLFAPLHLMNRTFLNPGEGSTGAVALAAIWRRPLSAGEWSLLYRDPFSLFASSPLYALAAPVQIVRPVSDVSVGSWTTESGGTTTLYQAIDEITANDSDYVRSPVAPSASKYRVRLAPLANPGVNTGHKLRYRVNITPADGAAMNWTVRVFNASTEVVSWTHSNISTATTFEQTLSEAQAAALDRNAIDVEWEASQI